MRPKKRILIVDADETRAGIWRCVLCTSGYAVRVASTAPEALNAAWEFSAEAVLVILPVPEAQSLLRQLRQTMPLVKTMVYADGMKEAPAELAADRVQCGRPLVADIMELLRMLTLRKRGPVERYKLADLVRKPVTAETPAPAAESRVA
jgi:CheY-like chemotaxis protein